MMQTVLPGKRTGSVDIPSSKSMAHRYLISAALSENESMIRSRGLSQDISATISCLNAMGAGIKAQDDRIRVVPVRKEGKNVSGSSDINKNPCLLPCGESGSTLRFLLPVAGALGCDAVFKMEGRLPERPMKEFEDVLRLNGMNIERANDSLICSGTLHSADYALPGNISSQYFTGLLFALPLLDGESRILIDGELESSGYFEMTKAVLKESGICWQEETTDRGTVIIVPGNQKYAFPAEAIAEGDYSSAAFFLCAGAFSDAGICVRNLSETSKQGDRRITDILEQFGANVNRCGSSVRVSRGTLRGIDIDASLIPDLIPVLSVTASVCEGTTRIYNAGRLRMKESDRLKSTSALLTALGAQVQEMQDGLVITGKKILEGGCTADTFNDHRIAMSAAVAACVCRKPVVITDAQCTAKSYPDFWRDFGALDLC